MNYKLVIVLVIFVGFIIIPSYAHKPIQPTDQNTIITKALQIPDHKKSWVIYESLKPYQQKFYSFDAKHADSFYASIVIPKLERFENYQPSLGLIHESKITDYNDIQAFLSQGGLISNYEGVIPSEEFYEPFGQATYWERQEIKLVLPSDGTYYLIVFDSQGIDGKLSLAIGTIEDFSMLDFFTVLPLAWIQTKIFFEDYISLSILFSLLASIPVLVTIKSVLPRIKNN